MAQSILIGQLLDELRSLDENESLEVKRGSEVGRSVMETICAFSNEPRLGGGTILLGVAEATSSKGYSLVGVEDPDKTQKDIASRCATDFNLRIRPQIKVESIEGKTIIAIHVAELPEDQKPLYFQSTGLPRGAFRRIGSTDQRCTDEDLVIFFGREKRFDSSIVEDSSLEDISDEALRQYRSYRSKVNPHAEELSYTDKELLRALNCIKIVNERELLTVAGLVVFGKKRALRRLMPMMRVDYLHAPSSEWITDPEHRYEQTEFNGGIISLVERIFSTIIADIPRAFHLSSGAIQARTESTLPELVLREAVVNALIHRSYREDSPIQIIRYPNRIEIHNAGYSLKPVETILDPGSVNRNALIASIFHETNLAETKGSGFRTMQRLMTQNMLPPPVFVSDRAKNKCTLTIFLHNLLSTEDMVWVDAIGATHLSDNQKLALVFLREIGAIDNSSYRQIAFVSVRQATNDLRTLKELGYVTQEGKSKGAIYKLAAMVGNEQTMVGNKQTMVGNDQTMVGNDQSIVGKASVRGFLTDRLPQALKEKIEALKGRSEPQEISQLILEVGEVTDFSATEIAALLKRNEKYVKSTYLRPLLDLGELEYTIPDMPRHPMQRYRVKKQQSKPSK